MTIGRSGTGQCYSIFGNGSGVNGTEMAAARSTDGGRTYPSATFFSFETGSRRFNDKPMITMEEVFTATVP